MAESKVILGDCVEVMKGYDDEMGFDFTGIKIDKEYFDASCKRFNNYKKQLNLFI